MSGEHYKIDEIAGGLAVMNTINSMSVLNLYAVSKSIPKQETLFMRSFAPWDWFGSEWPLCFYNCYKGNNRSFSTSRDPSVTSKVAEVVEFLLPGMTLVGPPTVYSDVSEDVYGRTRPPTPSFSAFGNGDGKLHLEMAASNPLDPIAPDIDVKLDISVQVKPGQACYSGHLYGDAFPNAEVFVVNSHDQATMLNTFTTAGGRNSGPFRLFGNNNRDMGSFSNKCTPE